MSNQFQELIIILKIESILNQTNIFWNKLDQARHKPTHHVEENHPKELHLNQSKREQER